MSFRADRPISHDIGSCDPSSSALDAGPSRQKATWFGRTVVRRRSCRTTCTDQFRTGARHGLLPWLSTWCTRPDMAPSNSRSRNVVESHDVITSSRFRAGQLKFRKSCGRQLNFKDDAEHSCNCFGKRDNRSLGLLGMARRRADAHEDEDSGRCSVVWKRERMQSWSNRSQEVCQEEMVWRSSTWLLRPRRRSRVCGPAGRAPLAPS